MLVMGDNEEWKILSINLLVGTNSRLLGNLSLNPHNSIENEILLDNISLSYAFQLHKKRS